MPQAQFFQLNPQTSLADDLKSGYEAGYNMQEGQRKKNLNTIYSKHVKPDGSFDSESFLKEASDAGIGPELTTAWLGQKTAKSEAAVKEASNAEMLSVLGRKPDVLRDWFEQEKQKRELIGRPTETGSGAPVTSSSLDVDSLPGSQKDFDTKYNTSAVETPVQTPVEIPVGTPVERKKSVTEQLDSLIKPKSDTEMDLGSGKITAEAPIQKDTPEGKFTESDISNLTAQPFMEPEKKYDVVEEALRREPGQGISAKLGEIATPGTFQTDSVKWEPKDDGSNEFRQFKTALDSQLKANGLGSASEYLQKIGENTYKQNLYVPNQTAWMTKDGKIDYAAMGAEIAKVKDSDQKARAKAEEAIQKAKDNLMETAQKYGVSTIASISESREKEKQEADYAGRRAGGYKFRPVTTAEEAKGNELVSSYFDIRDGIKRGGFDGAYAAALAKAKADGSVNSDAIVGNLVAMGAIPSNQAVYIKSLMSQNGSMSGDMWNQAKAAIGNFASKGVDKAWATDALNNIKESATLYGYMISDDTKVPTGAPSDKTKGAKTPAAKAMAKPAKSVGEKKTETALERVRRLRGKN